VAAKARFIQQALVGLEDFPHSHLVDHDLIDADTRLKDPRYAKIQTDALLTVLRELESD
jgi:hypothetical protein